MDTINGNPFAVLSLIAAPAVLTNASSVLALGTSNRFARAIDRARALGGQIESTSPTHELREHRLSQLKRVERRSFLLLNALTCFYLSLGSFAAASLVSILGASLTASHREFGSHITLWLALIAGAIGVGSIVLGCSLLVSETRLAMQNLTEEGQALRKRVERVEEEELERSQESLDNK
jgi:hypothetical protein